MQAAQGPSKAPPQLQTNAFPEDLWKTGAHEMISLSPLVRFPGRHPEASRRVAIGGAVSQDPQLACQAQGPMDGCQCGGGLGAPFAVGASHGKYSYIKKPRLVELLGSWHLLAACAPKSPPVLHEEIVLKWSAALFRLCVLKSWVNGLQEKTMSPCATWSSEHARLHATRAVHKRAPRRYGVARHGVQEGART